MAPRTTEPSTCPQIPWTSFSGPFPFGTTSTSHVLVPITLTSRCGRMPAPTAPTCASNAPTATTVSRGRPSRAAHSRESVPKGVSVVNVSRPKLAFSAGKRGWSRARNSSAGYPPKSACHMALWPAAHRLRRIADSSSQPVSQAGGGPSRTIERVDHRGFHRLEVVELMLPEPVLDRIAEQALLPARVMLDARRHDVAVRGAHHHAADGIRSEIDPQHQALCVSH